MDAGRAAPGWAALPLRRDECGAVRVTGGSELARHASLLTREWSAHVRPRTNQPCARHVRMGRFRSGQRCGSRRLWARRLLAPQFAVNRPQCLSHGSEAVPVVNWAIHIREVLSEGRAGTHVAGCVPLGGLPSGVRESTSHHCPPAQHGRELLRVCQGNGRFGSLSTPLRVRVRTAARRAGASRLPRSLLAATQAVYRELSALCRGARAPLYAHIVDRWDG